MTRSYYKEQKIEEEDISFPWDNDNFTLRLDTFTNSHLERMRQNGYRVLNSSPLRNHWSSHNNDYENEQGRIHVQKINRSQANTSVKSRDNIQHISPLSDISIINDRDDIFNRSPSIISRRTQPSLQPKENWKISRSFYSSPTIVSSPMIRSISVPKNADNLIIYTTVDDQKSAQSFSHFFNPTYSEKRPSKLGLFSRLMKRFKKNV
ncbi:hypothetical protein BCV72DRAFT_15412 [Rhizopus microsporus var. microsporus]|uniref:Uncharacterized protein n=2 Tax=Rhizopus microsporus TaxID=58291 RepID=A0A2G4SN83_RHIZD|nr:uncharacterized protein RHIMIDRAFT_239720 [Rhizopus microsporus ATCC 52813]ORE10574.1 hypothetical protein BCV72DRAFT_15412 [Rhizopus microsporus var. microsporus]PHZ10247.1 hypothetical protein RHIMIDRAFT_239720 [Rhizopus microsporus ATCC 52813]